MSDGYDPFGTAPGRPLNGPSAPGSNPDHYGGGGDPFVQPGGQPGGSTAQWGDTRSSPSWSSVPGSGSPFDQHGSTFDNVVVGKPPLVWLFVALVLGLAAAVVAFFRGAYPAIAILSWMVAGPVSVGLLAVYSASDIAQQARPIYTSPSFTRPLYWGVAAVALVGVVVSAFWIAIWVGRL